MTPAPGEPYRPPPAADLSVVICTHTRERPRLRAALRSVRQQRDAVGEVIVVVDHDEPLLASARAAFGDLAVIPNTGRPGLSGARDTGAAYCSGPIVAFLDDDATADRDWSRRITASYDGPDVIAVGGRIEPAWPRRRPSWWPPEFDWVVGCSYRGLPLGRYPVRTMVGTNMSVRRDVLCELGGFSSAGPMDQAGTGQVETGLCERAYRRYPDAEILYEPAATVTHVVPADRTTWRYFLRRCHREGRCGAPLVPLLRGEHALPIERDYARRTLPLGALRGLVSRDPRRAVAVGLGLLAVWLGQRLGSSEPTVTPVAAEHVVSR